MKYNSKKNKLKTIFDNVINTSTEINKKKQDYDDLSSSSEGLKVPKILYDSDWIIAITNEGG